MKQETYSSSKAVFSAKLFSYFSFVSFDLDSFNLMFFSKFSLVYIKYIFANIKIKDSSDVVGVRESRRVVGEYTLTAEDLIMGKKHKDVIVHNACFPLDIHNPNGAGQAESLTLPQGAQPYDIPYRAILPKRNSNLLLSGRIISGTHRAHASYRVMNIATCIGESAGISAGLCVIDNTTPKQLKVEKIQEILKNKGIDLFS